MAWQYAQTTLQVKWSSIFNELHIDETPHQLFSSLPVRLLINIKCWLTWQEVKHNKTTYLGNLNGAEHNKQQIRKIPMSIFWLW